MYVPYLAESEGAAATYATENVAIPEQNFTRARNRLVSLPPSTPTSSPTTSAHMHICTHTHTHTYTQLPPPSQPEGQFLGPSGAMEVGDDTDSTGGHRREGET